MNLYQMRRLLKRFTHAPSQWDSVVPRSPVSRNFGFDRGTPIDRIYIEQFLKANSLLISGDVFEVGGEDYSRKFGDSRCRSITAVGHVNCPQSKIVIDLEGSNSNLKECCDCFILTQVLFCTLRIERAIQAIFEILRPQGTALITVPGIAPISHRDRELWGDYWRFTPQSLLALLADVFPRNGIEIKSYGNCYAAAMFMYGYAAEELEIQALSQIDPDYPIVVTAVARK